MISHFIAIRTPSVANLREHHHARARRAKAQRAQAFLEMRTWLGWKKPELPIVITITRSSPKNILDDDNLGHALKSFRDGIADFLGVDDADPRVRYRYAQVKGPPGLQLSLEAAPGPPGGSPEAAAALAGAAALARSLALRLRR